MKALLDKLKGLVNEDGLVDATSTSTQGSSNSNETFTQAFNILTDFNVLNGNGDDSSDNNNNTSHVARDGQGNA